MVYHYHSTLNLKSISVLNARKLSMSSSTVTLGSLLSKLHYPWNFCSVKKCNPFEVPPPEPENYQPNLPGFNVGQQLF
jgi:hypothetical protein